MIAFKKLLEFEWDRGNQEKNWFKHEVDINEAEEAFFDTNKQEYPDPTHSGAEIRKIVVGKTNAGRMLFVVYTMRKNKIRIVSARDLNKKKEKELYEKAPYTTKI
jgi:uncharacterized protein